MKLHAPSRAVGVVSAGVVFLVATAIFAQQFSEAQASEQTTVKLVADMLRFHISQKQLDDQISIKLFDRYLKDLDHQKLYFLKSDVNSFAKYRVQLDDLIKQGHVAFAHEAWNLYLQRLDERVSYAHQLINKQYDFTVDESMDVDGDKMDWAGNIDELNERWRKRIKYELLSLQLEKTSVEEARTRLHKRYDTFNRYEHDSEDSEVLERFLSCLAHCYDPHSSYMSPQSEEDFKIQMRLSLEGIGAALRSEDGMTTVAQIVAGGAADDDKRLMVGDKIIGVGQEDGDFQDVVEMRLNRVVRLIRGKLGTRVRLKILRGTETQVIELVRKTIELKSSEVKGEIIQASEFGVAGKGRIGVINIPSFYRDFAGAAQGRDDFKSTARDVAKVLSNFKASGGVDAIMIDLRMNGGGALSEAIEVTGLFIDKGPVVQVKEQNGRIKSHDDEEDGVVSTAPLIVVCNRLSASASEIFAAAIKDYGRGIVVGDTTTHGKGTVQNVMPVSKTMFKILPNQKDLGALKLTINQFYRVNGDSTQNKGVESDIVLPSLIDHMDLGESFLENALAFDHIQPARYSAYTGYVTPEILKTLKKNSQSRIEADPKFQQELKSISRYVARKNRKTVSLNEEKLRSDREDDKAEKDVAKAEEDNENKSDKAPVLAKSEYNTELLSIAVDYASMFRSNQKAAAR